MPSWQTPPELYSFPICVICKIHYRVNSLCSPTHFDVHSFKSHSHEERRYNTTIVLVSLCCSTLQTNTPSQNHSHKGIILGITKNCFQICAARAGLKMSKILSQKYRLHELIANTIIRQHIFIYNNFFETFFRTFFSLKFFFFFRLNRHYVYYVSWRLYSRFIDHTSQRNRSS